MVEPHRLMPHCACWGRGGATRQDARPGRGWCAHAGVGGRTLDRHGAPGRGRFAHSGAGFGLWAYLPESEEGLRGPRSAALGKLGSGAPHSPFGHAASGRGTRLLL